MRRSYVDWARGVAVLVMIEAHTFDAWTRTADRASLSFRNLTILGGFAAPLFLFLAGLGLLLSVEARAGVNRRQAALRAVHRGLEIFVLAFLFRLQALVVTPGSPVIDFFRVDILNIMGPSLVAAALVWGLLQNRVALVVGFAGLATAIALVTPLVRTADWVNALPIWFQWYIRPAGEHTTFTAFPWAGFVFVGGAVGTLLARAGKPGDEARLHAAIAGAGIALLVLGFATAARPSIYALSSFWTSSPTYFAIRVGVLLLALAAIYAIENVSRRAGFSCEPLEKLGRSSLFLYWIHVELVYGYAAWPIRQRLGLWPATVAYVLFCALMYGSLLARDRVVERWRARSSDRSPFIISS